MRLVHCTPDRIELRGRDVLRAPFWVGAGLLLGPSVLALLGPAPFTPLHVVGLTLLILVGSGLTALGWKRLRWVRIQPGARTLETSEGDTLALEALPTVRLVAVPTRGSSGNALYGATLEHGERRTLLVASPDPAQTLRDLTRLRQALPLRIVGGWGLPMKTEWTDLPAPDAAGRHRDAPWDDRAARRPVAITMLVFALGIATTLVLEVKNRIRLGDDVGTMSIVLPIAVLGLLLLVTAVVATHGVRMSLGATVECRQTVLGVAYGRRSVPRRAVSEAYLVSPTGHHSKHVLFRTEDGPVAFPCDDVSGRAVLDALGRPATEAAS